MADRRHDIILFPKRPKSSNRLDGLQATPLAEAEWRANMLSDLLAEISGPDGIQPDPLRLNMVAYAAQEILDEMVLLYRRALSDAQAL